MKKYIFSFCLFLLSLFFIDNAYAVNIKGWANQLEHPSRVFLYSCSGAKSCTSERTLIAGAPPDYTFITSSTLSTPANGFMWAFNTPVLLRAGYLYSVTAFVCSEGNTSSNAQVEFDDISAAGNLTAVTNFTSTTTIYSYAQNTISTNVFDGDALLVGQCGYVSSVFSPSGNAQYIGLKMDHLGTVNVYEWFVGYELRELGIANAVTKSDITSAIDNSGLATAQSVQDVRDAQEQLQQDIADQTEQQHQDAQETQRKIDNINDSITSEEQPDLDSLQNSSGWLPPGPIDSILNLPLSLLNNLNTNLSKTCQPVQVNLPYVNESVSLPCLNTIYSQMGNLSSWINGIGVIAAAFILFKYFINLYKWVDDTLTFRENNWLDNWGGL